LIRFTLPRGQPEAAPNAPSPFKVQRSPLPAPRSPLHALSSILFLLSLPAPRSILPKAALSFFTDKAFRYWLPAFMLAELESPVEADIIAEGIAFHLTEASGAGARLREFAPEELKAIGSFCDECAERYDDIRFRDAARAVRARIQKA
jgi:hypothetical protein